MKSLLSFKSNIWGFDYESKFNQYLNKNIIIHSTYYFGLSFLFFNIFKTIKRLINITPI